MDGCLGDRTTSHLYDTLATYSKERDSVKRLLRERDQISSHSAIYNPLLCQPSQVVVHLEWGYMHRRHDQSVV